MFNEFGKNKPNRRERHQNKHALAKKQRTKQKNINRGWWDGDDLDRNDINIENQKKLEEWYIACIKWNIFRILNKSKERFFEAEFNKNIPSQLLKLLVVWDVVYFENKDWHSIIEKRWTRSNYLSRIRSDSSRFWSEEEQIIAANIDVALIVAPIQRPVFDHRLVDRYLVLCQNWWVTPVICLNKVDLTDERDPMIKHYKELWIDIIETSTISGNGISELKTILKGKVAVVLWKSWVWKSSLINELSSDIDLKTQNVNEKSWEWKHTTTSSDLYKWDKRSYIIDTPWIRALWIDHVSKDELKNYFPEFFRYQGMCKYDDCLHDSEPWCAIKKAVEYKEIKKERYDSYIRMLEDLV